jgi:dethiobiotin synthetase
VRGLFITGTDTGVGKTVLSACLLAAMRAAGEPVRAFKPVVTGLEEPPARAGGQAGGGIWPADHELLALAAGMEPEQVAPLLFGPAVSPHLAAGLAGTSIDPEKLLAAARDGDPAETLIAEGVGGLLVPLAGGYTVCDFARELGLDVLIAARRGLGTINHTLLTLRAARAAGLRVRAVVLTPWPVQPSVMERSNRETIERLGEAQVAVLGHVRAPEPELLAAAGKELPWRSWLAAARSSRRAAAAPALSPSG